MSLKFDSLMRILNMLDRKEPMTMRSLMNELRIGERSGYRYMTTLRDAGFPIVYNREKNTYAFEEGYSLGRPDVSAEETLTFALAKKMLGNIDPGMERTLESMETKLSLKKTAGLQHIYIPREELPAMIGGHFAAIQSAGCEFRRIEIVYHALSYDEVTTRKVDPYYLFIQEGFWHFRGYCHLRQEFRTFALDRILMLKTLDEYFLPRSIPEQDEIAGAFAGYVDGDPVDVVLRFDVDMKPYILRRKWHSSQREKVLDDGRLEVTLTVNGTEGIRQWVYRWLPSVEVVAPEELKDALIEDLALSLERHKSVT